MEKSVGCTRRSPYARSCMLIACNDGMHRSAARIEQSFYLVWFIAPPLSRRTICVRSSTVSHTPMKERKWRERSTFFVFSEKDRIMNVPDNDSCADARDVEG